LCVDVVDKVVRRGMEALSSVPGEHQGAAIAEMLCAAASEASARIYDQAAADSRLQGMGTTLTGLFLFGERGFVVHVGDSRAFLMRGGTCRQLTNDHSWLNEQVQAGLLTEEEAAASDLKHIITRSVGFERHVDADVVPVSIIPGDAFLLCSDGMSNYINGDEIGQLARDHWYADLPKLCADLANKRGGDDNITVVVAFACNDRDERKPVRPLRRTHKDTLPPGKISV
jgi:protein phosphatase